jgi:hypothetical protein
VKINRTALAAAASVVAVVVAGTAALAANFGILSGSEDQADAIPSIVSSIADDGFVDVPVQEVTATTEASQTLAYQVEGVGVVTLTRTADVLAVASIDVDPQWDAAQLPSAEGVSIRFTSSSQVIAFSATVIDSQVVVDVVDETPAPAAGSYDDDDHGSESHGYDDDEGSYDDD